MADGTQLNTGVGGDLIETDELSTLNGVDVSGLSPRKKVQRNKVGFGTDSDFRDVDATHPLPVDVSDRAARLLGHVTVDNASLSVTGPLTDTQLRAVAVPVSGPLSDTQLRASAVPVSLATNTPDVTDRVGRLLGHVTLDNASLAVTGTFWQATQPVSAAALPLPAGAAQEHATAVSPHSVRLSDGASYLGTTGGRLQVADGGVALAVSGPLTDTQLRASAVPVSGTVTVSNPFSGDVSDRTARLLGHVTVDNASLAVTGTFWQATQPVSATALPLPAGASTETTLAAVNTKLGNPLAVTESGTWTVGLSEQHYTPADALSAGFSLSTTALNEIYNGATFDRMRAALGANTGVQAYAGDSLVVSGTGVALNDTPIASTDVRAYRWVGVHITGVFSATYAFEVSNDNANWLATGMQFTSANTGTGPSSTSSATNLLFYGPLTARYFRVRVSAYTSGTVTATALLSALPSQQVVQAVDTELPAAAALADAVANPTTAIVGAASLGYNGSTLDRLRTVAGANATTGTGLLGTALMAFDGSTNYNALRSPGGVGDASGMVTSLAVGPWGYNGSTWDRLRTAPGSTGTLAVSQKPATSGGLTSFRKSATADTNLTSVKGSAGQVYGWTITNTSASTKFVKLYNKASAPVIASDAALITMVLAVPASGVLQASFNSGIAFGTGVAYAITGAAGDTDTTALVANDVMLNLLYA